MLKISTSELFALLNKKKVHIADVRLVDSYNGWRMNKPVFPGKLLIIMGINDRFNKS